MPLASIMKIYVLLAVARAVSAGTLSWDDKVTVTAEGKKLGSAGMDNLAPGTQVTVHEAAQQMISVSDNMATDMLINKVGPAAVDEALVVAGHHDPASLTPYPTMHELFSIGWGKPDVRDQWKNGTKAQRYRDHPVQSQRTVLEVQRQRFICSENSIRRLISR